MTLYHCSNVAVERPNFSLSRKNLDFGIGFYTTVNKEQAIDCLRRVHTPPLLGEIKGMYPETNTLPKQPYLVRSAAGLVDFARKMMTRKAQKSQSVSTYDFDMNVAESLLDILRFPAPDRLWLDFVHKNRRGIYAGKMYDLVIGPVANDDVFATLIVYEQGILNVEQTLEALKVKKLYSQFVFKTEKALSLLKYVDSFKPGAEQ
jgi:hypothetical protein